MAIIAFDNHVEDLLLSINKVWLVKKKKILFELFRPHKKGVYET